ncbi:MAG TPA: hypothetical protein VKT28_10695 [Puia sp.]|nr:hypothetical protein [Puia sp.]
MFKYFDKIFKPRAIVYSYDKPKTIIEEKIAEVFAKRSKFFSEVRIYGSFTSNETFELTFTPLLGANTYGVNYSSTLIGRIIQASDSSTQIEIKTKPSIAFVILLIISLIASIISLIVAIIYLLELLIATPTGSSFWLIIMLIISPAFIIWFVNISNAGAIDRFEMFVDNPLRQ